MAFKIPTKLTVNFSDYHMLGKKVSNLMFKLEDTNDGNMMISFKSSLDGSVMSYTVPMPDNGVKASEETKKYADKAYDAMIKPAIASKKPVNMPGSNGKYSVLLDKGESNLSMSGSNYTLHAMQYGHADGTWHWEIKVKAPNGEYAKFVGDVGDSFGKAYDHVWNNVWEHANYAKPLHFANTVNSWEKDGYTLYEYDDGTYGYKTKGGKTAKGYKDKGAASSAGGTKAKKESKTVKQKWTKDGYTLFETEDGLFGFKSYGGVEKFGYKDKGAASSAGNSVAKKEKQAAAKLAADLAHKETELKIAAMESELSSVYTQASDEMKAKWEKYMKDFAKKDKVKNALLNAGQITMDEYIQWRKGQVLIGERWQEMADVLSKDLVNADRIAANIINNGLPDVYAINHNYATFQVEQGSLVNTSYTLYDRNTVQDLIVNKPDLLPSMVINDGADYAFNKQKVTSAITQGILQGESIPQMAARLQSVAQMDYNTAVRSARTMSTAAQNKGRIDGYDRAEKMGIKLKKQWIAALDSRTRWSHVLCDEEIVGTHEKFSNGLEYPGDPHGAAHEVYNCRCTLVPIVDGVDVDVERNSKLGSMTYDEWKAQAKTKSPEHKLQVLADQYNVKQNDIITAYGGISIENIWYNKTVKIDDYESLKSSGSIDKKKQYFQDKLNDPNTLEIDKKKYSDFLDTIDDFEIAGEQYLIDKKALDTLQSDMLKLKQKASGSVSLPSGSFSADCFTPERKAAASLPKTREQADKMYRGRCGEVWRNATKEEKYAIVEYTTSYSKFNEPLRGWEYGKANYKTGTGFYGIGNTNLNAANNGKRLNAMTDIIDKSWYDFDVKLIRGTGYDGIAGEFGVDKSLFNRPIEEIKATLIGRTGTEYGFMSCGSSAGTGFTHKPVVMHVYAPSGTKMMYAEPFSSFGYGSTNWDGVSGSSALGSELETIVQQGAKLRCADVYQDGGKLHVEVEIIGNGEVQRWKG